jgi:hypothetical protein
LVLTNDDPAARTAARPADVYAIALLERMARTRAPMAAARSTSATMAWVASVAEPKTADRKDLCLGSVR